jgi:TolB-like protein/Flp pilus assembly protein TadD
MEASLPAGAVFLSYASQDAEAAHRIAAALRAAGIEVWFDRAELRGGDAWDRRIREQIHDCRLFIPVISAQTEAREEGYFRREWRLAVERAGDMAEKRAFLVPVVIDATSERGASVPDKFRELQWTHLPGGETSTAFIERVRRLLAGEGSSARVPPAARAVAAGHATEPAAPSSRSKAIAWLAGAVLAIAFGCFVIERPWIPKRPATAATATAAAPEFSPPPHSVAVLPFVNMSGDKDQEYFSDGLTEEVLNSLARINELQVAARTSSFSFQGEHPDIATVAHKLNVGAVLEGSVRRSASTVRITAQLVNGVTGFHLWSETYDRPLGDVLQLQTQIATAVASALKVRLLGGEAARIEVGGTRNPAAFDAYLRGRRIAGTASSGEEYKGAIAAFTEAIGLDSSYASAFAERALALGNYAKEFDADPRVAHESFDNSLKDARTATTLAPELAEAYYALGVSLQHLLEFEQSDAAFARALALAPGSARILSAYSRHAVASGHTEAAIDAGRRAVILDPLNFNVHRTVGIALLQAREYTQALSTFQTAISLQPDYLRNYVLLGETQYAMGVYETARKSCEVAPADTLGERCLAMTYRKLARNSEADAMLRKLKSQEGDAGAWDYAAIYAQWGDIAKALDWLETAARLRDPSLAGLSREPYFDPLEREPRFRAIVQQLKFPE